MKLYHGTSKKHLFGILQNGITPRSVNKKSNWEEIPSNPSMVYLTNAYPLFFSAHASSEHGNIGAIVEIDTSRLDDSNFLPDEDFISQANAAYKGKNKKNVITDVHRIRKELFGYQPYWENSLKRLGNCCHYGVIPAEAITRYCIVDWDKRKELVLNYTDYAVSITHYAIRGAFYRNVVKWFFGDRKLLPADMCESVDEEISDEAIAELPKGQQHLLKMIKDQRNYRIKTSKNRNGIKVAEL